MDAGTLSKKTQILLRQYGFPPVHLHECVDGFSSFSSALADAVDHNEFGPYVDKHSVAELRISRARAFLSRSQMAGIAVWPDGNIRAVFNDKRSGIHWAIGEMMLTALSVGGNKLDCFDGMLRIIYSKFGFIPVARVKFDPAFAPDNWKEEFGTPDIIFWMHCKDSVETVAANIMKYPKYTPEDIQALPCFDSYEEAYQYRDAELAKIPCSPAPLFTPDALR